MDTKWKNRKKVISFLIFFLGASMTLGSIADLIRNKPSDARIWQADKMLEEDYQQSRRFREYIANRLENLLIMVTGGIRGYDNGGYYDGNYYYGSFYNDYFEDYGGILRNLELEPVDMGIPQYAEDSSMDFGSIPYDSLENMISYLYSLENILENYNSILDDMNVPGQDTIMDYQFVLKEYQEDILNYQQEILDCRQEILDYQENLRNYLYNKCLTDNIKPLTEEQKQQIAEKYHNQIKGDKNLLYTAAYDGNILYSNSDLLSAEGQLSAPEGYNFILYFDGERVRILKDGKEINVYGDGFYRENSDWYVPGYKNFQLDENAKKATVCIAAAKDPVLYMEGSYGNGGSIQYDNGLYWMNTNLKARRTVLVSDLISLSAGILLLLLAFFCRKSRREAAEGIARFQAKIWAEAKVLLLLAMLYLLCRISILSALKNYGFSPLEELLNAWEYANGFDATLWYYKELAVNTPFVFWILLFWGIYLIRNDLKHNKKLWRHSLTAKLYRTFSAKSLNHPLPRKMGRRSRAVFAASVLYGLLMLAVLGSLSNTWRVNTESLRNIQLLTLLGTILFLVLQYLAGSKNMKVARDIEALSRRISEIRNGNITDQSSSGRGEDTDTHSDAGTEPLSGHDLEAVMTQLEDIRHGMANAVDEQMKSERMKVELIANVSHDIKTPLTSIISYVEFLKQEKELPDHVKDYIKILDEKSQRLKNMVQDVFTVSKAASGQLPLQMEALDFGKLLLQTMADMEEEINGSPLAFRTEIPDAPVMIMADGQRMYRVFQNLFQNCLKYSLSGSRVYVTLKTDGHLAVASVKNTSRLELEKGKNFAERFTRGDQSRTDGGSGLGLSIAQSFTEACGGEFSWETDADLFVVRVSFQTL